MQEGRTAVLEMPSALVPGELCAVLNPRFPQFAERVQVALVRPFQFDPRLWKLKR